MLSQFRQQYPQGSLTSELLMIDHGLYIVRAIVQVENIPLASGLAAAAKLEDAEDQARLRALSLLDLNLIATLEPTALPIPPTLPTSPPLSTPPAVSESFPVPKTPRKTAKVAPAKAEVMPLISEPEAAIPEITVPEIAIPDVSTTVPSVIEQEARAALPLESSAEAAEPVLTPEPTPALTLTPPPALTLTAEPELVLSSPEPLPLPEILEPVLSLSPHEEVPLPLETLQEPLAMTTEAAIAVTSVESEVSETVEIPEVPETAEPSKVTPLGIDPNAPIDFSEIISRSNVELKRLGWTSDQGRNYLLQTYGKRSRQLLSDEELLEFLVYLQAQPNPV
jgi:hypothetical protein